MSFSSLFSSSVVSLAALGTCSLLLAGCALAPDPIAGTWVEPVPGMPGMEQGFTLKADGSASSVNMATLTTERWTREGDRLILEGKSIGNGQTIDYRDEWMILEAGDTLRLRKGNGAVRTYTRKP